MYEKRSLLHYIDESSALATPISSLLLDAHFVVRILDFMNTEDRSDLVNTFLTKGVPLLEEIDTWGITPLRFVKLLSNTLTNDEFDQLFLFLASNKTVLTRMIVAHFEPPLGERLASLFFQISKSMFNFLNNSSK